MTKPVSFAALSLQVRLIWLADTADPLRLDGAAGVVPDVVADAVFEYAEVPAPLVAATRYE